MLQWSSQTLQTRMFCGQVATYITLHIFASGLFSGVTREWIGDMPTTPVPPCLQSRVFGTCSAPPPFGLSDHLSVIMLPATKKKLHKPRCRTIKVRD